MRARPEAAIAVLGGPRSGKTTSVLIPAVLHHNGPVVSTSTKPDVALATAAARMRMGVVWVLDLDGAGVPDGCRRVRYSPVQSARDFDDAQKTASAMVGAAALGEKAEGFADGAGSLLAACLHAAAIDGRPMSTVLDWVLGGPSAAEDAQEVLDGHDAAGARMASRLLSGTLSQPNERLQGSWFSTASEVLRAYRTASVLDDADEGGFSAREFVASDADSLYLWASAEDSTRLAPVVVALLDYVRRETYRLSRERGGRRDPPVLLALDEAANIAPLPGLAGMLSEGGGQGLQTIVCLQSMAQARERWGEIGADFLGLAGVVVALPGLADPDTLERLSLLAGVWDRPVETIGRSQAEGTGQSTSVAYSMNGGSVGRGRTHSSTIGSSRSVTTRVERRLKPEDIAALRPFDPTTQAPGDVVIFQRPDWELLPLVPWFADPAISGTVLRSQIRAVRDGVGHPAVVPPELVATEPELIAAMDDDPALLLPAPGRRRRFRRRR